MREIVRRITQDLTHLRNIDAYAITLVVFVFAALSLVGDILPVNSRWAILLVGVGLLVFRITLPDRYDGSPDDVLKDRSAFEMRPFPLTLRQATELWIFAPTAVNILAPQNCDSIRSTILEKPDGAVRVVVLDPRAEAAIQFATRQLDDSLDSPSQLFKSSLDATISQLRRMARWNVRGSFRYKFIDYSPGFSMVAINPAARHGQIIVEFHGFHNQVTNSRMHIEIMRTDSEHWYAYWLGQFDFIWRSAHEGDPNS